MTKIKKMSDQIMDEVCGAKEYAEMYVESKAKGNQTWANRYREMSLDELKHAQYIHEATVSEIEEIRRVVTPPQEMLDKWEKLHADYVDKAAWVRQMLAL